MVVVVVVPFTVVVVVVLLRLLLVVVVVAVMFHNKLRGRTAKKSVWRFLLPQDAKMPSTVSFIISVNNQELRRINTSGLTRIIQSYEGGSGGAAVAVSLLLTNGFSQVSQLSYEDIVVEVVDAACLFLKNGCSRIWLLWSVGSTCVVVLVVVSFPVVVCIVLVVVMVVTGAGAGAVPIQPFVIPIRMP